MSVLVVDYGMSNLGSIRRALEECGADVMVSDEPGDIRLADRIVLPGVGSFTDGMRNLCAAGWDTALIRAVRQDRLPLLGICLGMQLLADSGTEGGDTLGLGLIPGTVTRLIPDSPDVRIPHVGWNEVFYNAETELFFHIQEGTDFYFVHSYHFVPKDTMNALCRTPYCESFVSVVGNGVVFGVQFHPEKSGKPGFQLLKNFLSL